MNRTHRPVRSYNGQAIEGTDPMGRQITRFTAMPLSALEQTSGRRAVDLWDMDRKAYPYA